MPALFWPPQELHASVQIYTQDTQIHVIIQNKNKVLMKRGGEISQQLGARAAPSEDPGLITSICKSSFRGSEGHFWPLWTLYTWYIDIHEGKILLHIQRSKKKKNVWKEFMIGELKKMAPPGRALSALRTRAGSRHHIRRPTTICDAQSGLCEHLHAHAEIHTYT